MSFISYVNPVVWQSTVFSINISFLLLSNIFNIYFSQVPVDRQDKDVCKESWQPRSDFQNQAQHSWNLYTTNGLLLIPSAIKYKCVVVFATHLMPFYPIPLQRRHNGTSAYFLIALTLLICINEKPFTFFLLKTQVSLPMLKETNKRNLHVSHILLGISHLQLFPFQDV